MKTIGDSERDKMDQVNEWAKQVSDKLGGHGIGSVVFAINGEGAVINANLTLEQMEVFVRSLATHMPENLKMKYAKMIIEGLPSEIIKEEGFCGIKYKN